MNLTLVAALLFFQTGISEPENITWIESPHFSSRPAGQIIDAIVIHTTEGSTSASGTIGWFQNPNSNVSSHYIIDYEGEIFQMVTLEKKAWHATYYNSRSIGVDIAGKAYDPDTFGDLNMEALIDLVAWLCFTYDIPAVHPSGDAYDYPDDNLDEPGIVAHGQVQPWNRSDPGPYFDWEGFLLAVQQKLADAYALTPPGNLSTAIEGEEITFSWESVPSADLYQLSVAESAEDLASMTGTFQIIYVGEETSCSWTGGDSTISYEWSVMAQNNYDSATATASMPLPLAEPALVEEDDDDCSASLTSAAPPALSGILGILFLFLGTFALRGSSPLQ